MNCRTAERLADELRRAGVIAWAQHCAPGPMPPPEPEYMAPRDDNSVVIVWGMGILAQENTKLESSVFCNVRFILTLYPYWRGEGGPRVLRWDRRLPTRPIGVPYFPDSPWRCRWCGEAVDPEDERETHCPRMGVHSPIPRLGIERADPDDVATVRAALTGDPVTVRRSDTTARQGPPGAHSPLCGGECVPECGAGLAPATQAAPPSSPPSAWARSGRNGEPPD